MFPHEIGEKKYFTLGQIFGQKKHSWKITASILTPFSELLPNLYYSPIKKLENYLQKLVNKSFFK
jgi:hypothetical protein